MIACNIEIFLEIFLHLSTSSPFSQSIYSRRQLTTTHWAQTFVCPFFSPTYMYLPTNNCFYVFKNLTELLCDKTIYMYIRVFQMWHFVKKKIAMPVQFPPGHI